MFSLRDDDAHLCLCSGLSGVFIGCGQAETLRGFRLVLPPDPAGRMAQHRAPGFLQLDHEVRLRIVGLLAFKDRCSGRAMLQNPACPVPG